MFEFKHPDVTEIRYCFLNRARTAQWQQSKVSFTIAGRKLFVKSHSVANSYQKMCFRFPHWNIVYCTNGQQSHVQLQNSERVTANCSIIQEVPLFIGTTSRTVVVDIRHQLNTWCSKRCEPEKQIQTAKRKFHSANCCSAVCYRRKLQPPIDES